MAGIEGLAVYTLYALAILGISQMWAKGLFQVKSKINTLSNMKQISPDLRQEFLVFRDTISDQQTKKQQERILDSKHHHKQRGATSSSELPDAPVAMEAKARSKNVASLKAKSNLSSVKENRIDSDSPKIDTEILDPVQIVLEEALPWDSSTQNIKLTEPDVSVIPEIRPYKYSEDPSLMAHCPACGEILKGQRCPNFYFHLTE